MTRAALAAFRLAGDPAAFPEQIVSGLKPWQPAKLYLPAWSGAGASYDDEEPPPPATLPVEPPRRDPATGAAFAQIGEWSRACHASQGMGVWREDGPSAWPLHLHARAHGPPGAERDIRDGLPADLAALAGEPGVAPIVADALRQAQDAVEAAVAAFPDGPAIAAAALRAARSVEGARDASAPDPRLEHRLGRKLRELDAVVFAARGVAPRAAARPARVTPGGETAVEVFVDAGQTPAESRPVAAPHWRETGCRAGAADGRTAAGRTVIALRVAADAAPTSPYPPGFDPLGGNGEVAVEIALTVEGRRVVQLIDLEEPLLVLPRASLRLDPDAAIVNLALPPRDIAVAAALERADAGALAWKISPGWSLTGTADGVRLSPPARAEEGRFTFLPRLGGDAVHRVSAIRYPHVEPILTHAPVELPVLAVDAALPEGARVGYAGGGNDRVGIWLDRLGLDTVELDEGRLAQSLGDLTTVVVGILAFGTRPDLAAARPRLQAWVEAGGHLVTLYHRPRDGWDPDETPPRSLRIGLPSVRWRVTDPQAPVQVLAPDHPLLTRPNAIGPADWAGWDKERGLYFAAHWDPVYAPLLALSDPGERPLEGALLSGAIGRGRHTHVSLALHHQLDRLVPGAFRLLANLAQPA